MRTILRTGCVPLLILGVFCGAALASTHTGNQNPDLVVTASIGPNHLDVGERGIWAVTVTNTTSHRIRLRVEIAVVTPFTGEGEEIFGSLGAGQSIAEQHSFKARKGGSYTVTVKARDKNGTSHTRASAVA
jgi:hypothetical protein